MRGSPPENLPAGMRDQNQRRVEVRSAIRSSMQVDVSPTAVTVPQTAEPFMVPGRHMTAAERAELREQLRSQQPVGSAQMEPVKARP